MPIAPLLLASLLVAGQEPANTPIDPTKPSLVTLDFKDRPLPEVVAALAARSGNAVVLQFANDPDGRPRPISLTSPAPVPFWEAVDRLAVAAKLQWSLNDPGGFGARGVNVSFHGPASDPGPALHSGPLRFGRFALHATYRKTFAAGRGSAGTGEDGYRAEFQALPEPRALAVRTGPLEDLVAIDDRGRSLLDPARAGPGQVSPMSGHGLGPHQPLVVVRLATPEAGSKRLKSLRGVMPVEIGVAPKAPTATISLAESVGKTVRVGDVTFTIEEFTTRPGAPATLKLVARIEGPRAAETKDKALAWARTALIPRYLEVVDGQGRPVMAGAGGSSAADELRLNYTFGNVQAPGAFGSAPKSLRVYAPEWVRWKAPFEFADVPLP